MSTTITSEHMPTTPPRLSTVLSVWVKLAPGLDAPVESVADWFELAIRLLAEITTDLSHPQHAEAVALAAQFSHDALFLRNAQDAEDAR